MRRAININLTIDFRRIRFASSNSAFCYDFIKC
jgi:hypothetical protein